MTFVISDLHGYEPVKLARLMKKAKMTYEDTLFILGDVIDRGEFGIELLSFVSGIGKGRIFEEYLLREGFIRLGDDGRCEIVKPEEYELVKWLMGFENIQFILGNHEHMMLECERFFVEITEESCNELTSDDYSAMASWQMNGSDTTIKGLKRLLGTGREAVVGELLEFLKSAPRYRTVTVEGREYVLVHAGLGNFYPERALDSYSDYELVWKRPSYTTRCFEDKTVIFGHTPTVLLAKDKAYLGKAMKRDTWICIDAGVAAGCGPALLRLDDIAVYYGEEPSRRMDG